MPWWFSKMRRERERKRGSFACGGFAQCHAKAWFSHRENLGRETNKVKRLAQQQRFPVKVMDIMSFCIAVSSVCISKAVVVFVITKRRVENVHEIRWQWYFLSLVYGMDEMMIVMPAPPPPRWICMHFTRFSSGRVLTGFIAREWSCMDWTFVHEEGNKVKWEREREREKWSF